MLQTSQRIGNAIGAAVISAVFYAAVSRRARRAVRRGRPHYGHAYAMGLVVSVVFTVAALVVAIRDVRRRAAPRPGSAARRRVLGQQPTRRPAGPRLGRQLPQVLPR